MGSWFKWQMQKWRLAHNWPACMQLTYIIWEFSQYALYLRSWQFLSYIDVNIVWLPFVVYKNKHADIYKYTSHVLLVNLQISWGIKKEFNLAVEWKPRVYFFKKMKPVCWMPYTWTSAQTEIPKMPRSPAFAQAPAPILSEKGEIFERKRMKTLAN